MDFYSHLPKDRYVLTVDGRVKISQQVSITPLVADQPEQGLSDKIRLLTQYVTVGLWAVVPEATPQKVTERLTMASGAIFAASYLRLRDNNDVLFNQLPLLDVAKANANGHPYWISGSFINLSESSIYTPDNAGITAGTCLAINFDFAIPKRKHMSDIVNKNV